MNTNQVLPSDRLKASSHPVRKTLIALGAAVLIAASGTGAYAFNQAQQNTADAPRAVSVSGLLTHEEIAKSGQIAKDQVVAVAEQQQREAAAVLLAQQQADAAAASHHSASADGPVRCPAGSFANSSDGVNDTSCFPDICSHIQVPDPAHPECDSAFKP